MNKQAEKVSDLLRVAKLVKEHKIPIQSLVLIIRQQLKVGQNL